MDISDNILIFALIISCVLLILATLFIYMNEIRKRKAFQQEIEQLKKSNSDLKRRLSQKENKRNAYRLELHDENCKMKIMSTENPDLVHFIDEEWECTIDNLSATGMKLVCKNDIPVRSRIDVELKFEFRGEIFEFKGIIVRKEEYNHPYPQLIYGIRFVDLDSKERERIQLMINYAQAERFKGVDPEYV